MPSYIVYKLVEIGRVHDVKTERDAWRWAEEVFGSEAASVRLAPDEPVGKLKGKTLAQVFSEEAQPKKKMWNENDNRPTQETA